MAQGQGRRKGLTRAAQEKRDLHELEVNESMRRLRIRREAQARLAAEDWTPPVDSGTWEDEMEIEDEDIFWQVDELLQYGMNAMLVAEAKAGKTTMLLNVMRALVDEEPLFDRYAVTPVEEGARIAWWNAELSEPQARRWARDLEVQNLDALISLHLRGRAVPLDAPHVQDWAVKWLKRNNVKVWILDPLGALCTAEEKDNTAIRAWLRALDNVKKRAGVDTMIIAHHSGHGDPMQDADTRIIRARGASALKDWPDVTWTYYRGADKSNNRFMSAFGRDVSVDEFELSYRHTDRRLSWASGNSRKDSKLLDNARATAVALHELFAGDSDRKPMSQTQVKAECAVGDTNNKEAAIKKAVEMGWIHAEHSGQKILHTPGHDPHHVRRVLKVVGE